MSSVMPPPLQRHVHTRMHMHTRMHTHTHARTPLAHTPALGFCCNQDRSRTQRHTESENRLPQSSRVRYLELRISGLVAWPAHKAYLIQNTL